MKKLFLFVLIAVFFAACEKQFDEVTQDELMLKSAETDACVTIQDGELTYASDYYLDGVPYSVGYDIYGYNHNAHLFNGFYANANLNSEGYPPYEGDDEAYLVENPGAKNLGIWEFRDIKLTMKWNDAWLANSDCDGDGVLDRHYGFDSYRGSGAWCTNHMSGGKGKDKWTYFVKFVAAPVDAELVDGIWYNADGTEIGPDMWGQFATIQEVNSGMGATYVSPAGPGFGKY